MNSKIQKSLCFVDQGLVSVLSFLGAALVGRMSQEDELGIYYTSVATFWLLAGIPNALLWTPFTAKAAGLNQPRRQRYAFNLAIQLMILACMIALLLICTERVVTLLGYSPIWVTKATWGLVPFFLLNIVREHARRIYLSRIDGVGLLLLDIPITVGQVLLLAGLYVNGSVDSFNTLIAMSVPCLWAFWTIVSENRSQTCNWNLIRHQWNFNFQVGRLLLLATLITLLGDIYLRFSLGYIHSADALGRLAAVMIAVTLFNPIQLTVQNLTRSQIAIGFANGNRQTLFIQTIKATVATALSMGALYLFLSVTGSFFLNILFNRNIPDSQTTIVMLCIASFLQTLAFPVEAAITTLRESQTLLNSTIVKFAVVLLLSIPLIGPYEIVGFALVMSASFVVTLLYQWISLENLCRHVA